ncbi:MAG: Ig domain-containing protein, partial [Proteobacteria bacterium]|nr:Ig domain-containing protein [Pseudomonadota bacterium]
MMVKKGAIIAILLFLFPLFVFSGCGQKVSWIHLEPKSIELNTAGETFQLKFAALDKKNEPVPDAVLTWASSNEDVATVENGVLTAVSSGKATITVTSEEGEKAVCQCKVSILGSIKVEPDEVELTVGEKLELGSKVLNEKGGLFEDQVVGWASSDYSIVFIDDLGEITGVAPGEATITATTPGKAVTNAYG